MFPPKIVVWDPTFSIGVNKLDRQHQHFIRLTDRVIKAGPIHAKSEEMSEILGKITGYLQTHFADEEAHMVAIGYPRLAEHRLTHRQFIKQVVDFSTRVMAGNESVSAELPVFLQRWLVGHVLGDDQQLAA